MSTFADLAPRLHAAHQAERARLLVLDVRLHALRDDQLRLERLVAHRVLQEARAVHACGQARSTSRRRSAGIYLRRRQTLLKEAEDALARVRRRLREMERER